MRRYDYTCMTEGGVRSEELLRSRICGWHLPFTIQPCLPLSVQSVTFRGLRNEGCPHSVQLLMLRKGCSIDYDYSMFIQSLHFESFQDALTALINFDWPQQMLLSKLLYGPLYSSWILFLLLTQMKSCLLLSMHLGIRNLCSAEWKSQGIIH